MDNWGGGGYGEAFSETKMSFYTEFLPGGFFCFTELQNLQEREAVEE